MNICLTVPHLLNRFCAKLSVEECTGMLVVVGISYLSYLASRWSSCMLASLRASKVCAAKRWRQPLGLISIGDADMCALNWIPAEFLRSLGSFLCSLSKYCLSRCCIQALHLRSIDNLFAVLYDYELEGLTTASQEVSCSHATLG